MELKLREVMRDLKVEFADVFDPPNKITPENLSILLFEMSRRIGEAFAA
jgi:hypothetical protein